MKITEEIREFAAKNKFTEDTALAKKLEEKSEEFKLTGSNLYQEV